MAANARVEVYAAHGSVYACGEGKRIRLGKSSVCIAAVRIDSAAVAGDLVAYGAERCGIDSGTASVAVLRMRDGKRLRRFAAINGAVGPESIQSVTSLVVKRDASVAWIATVGSIIGMGSRLEVRANGQLLDSSVSIKPHSLQLHGSTLSWRDGDLTRSGTLS
jgi:hypothetical protein